MQHHLLRCLLASSIAFIQTSAYCQPLQPFQDQPEQVDKAHHNHLGMPPEAEIGAPDAPERPHAAQVVPDLAAPTHGLEAIFGPEAPSGGALLAMDIEWNMEAVQEASLAAAPQMARVFHARKLTYTRHFRSAVSASEIDKSKVRLFKAALALQAQGAVPVARPLGTVKRRDLALQQQGPRPVRPSRADYEDVFDSPVRAAASQALDAALNAAMPAVAAINAAIVPEAGAGASPQAAAVVPNLEKDESVDQQNEEDPSGAWGNDDVSPNATAYGAPPKFYTHLTYTFHKQ